jgi:hypothetical protein
MVTKICWCSLLALLALAQGCGDGESYSVPLFAEPNVQDLQSSFGAQDVTVTIRGPAGGAPTAQLKQEVLTGTRVVTFQGAAIALEASEVAGALGAELHFRPKGWSTTAWHKLEIKPPSVGRVEGMALTGGLYTARFISAAYLTVSTISICGQGAIVLEDGIRIAFSEAVTEPSPEEVPVYQGGVARTCAVVDTPGVTSSASWTLSCKQMDWTQEVEVRAQPKVAGKVLQDLAGALGYTARLKLPLGYASQEKWCYDVVQPDPPK